MKARRGFPQACQGGEVVQKRWVSNLEMQIYTGVKRAMTMKGEVLTDALLSGIKPVENRSCTWKEACYALHTGKSKAGKGLNEHVKALCGSPDGWATIEENLPRCPKGHIAGLIRFSHALPHSECGHSEWCTGPICHVVLETVWLETPIPAKGALGPWRLDDATIAKIREQLPRCKVQKWEHETAFPRNDASLERAKAEKRLAKATPTIRVSA